VQIVEVPDRGGSSRQAASARNEFLEFPYQHYRNDPHWVPPLRIAQKEILDTQKHPFYLHADMRCFLARVGGKPAGRIAAILDRGQFEPEKLGFFGFFESMESERVAAALVRAAWEWLAGQGARVMRGPVNPSTNYECGLLVEGFDSSPYVMMTHNARYYSRLLEAAGMRKAKDLWAYRSVVSAADMKRIQRVAERALTRQRLNIRPLRMDRFSEEVETVWRLYSSAWEKNWGFAPATREEFGWLARDMKQILAPELCLIGEVDGEPAGFALALPDINRALKAAGGSLFPFGLIKILYHRRKIRRLRILALGVVERHRTAGVAAAFYAELFRQATRLGYEEAESSWVLENNILMNRSLEALGAERYKTYRIYEWTP
jgi:GNAT superfamily N-acetyltransferase